jgi:DnaJ-class molecular chaperone
VPKPFYALLDVAPDAPTDEIKRAFRREIAKYHPDKVQHLGKEFQDIAASKAAELTRAYKTLTDPASREEYDSDGQAGESVAPPPSAPADAAAASARPHPSHGRRRRADIRVSSRIAPAQAIWCSARPSCGSAPR